MAGKKHPLTFFREAHERRMAQFQVGGNVGNSAEIDKKIEDLKHQRNYVPTGKKGVRQYNKLSKKIDKLKEKKQ